jgi:hypothetical protein
VSESTTAVLAIWQDQKARACRAEDQRATLTNIILTVSALGLGFISQKGLSGPSLPVAMGLVLLGLYGTLASAKLYERSLLHERQADALFELLEKLHPTIGLGHARQFARTNHEHDHKIMYNRVRLHAVWEALHLGVAGAGFLIVLLILL